MTKAAAAARPAKAKEPALTLAAPVKVAGDTGLEPALFHKLAVKFLCVHRSHELTQCIAKQPRRKLRQQRQG